MKAKLSIMLTTIALAVSLNMSAYAGDETMIAEGTELYTLTNLHPDPVNLRLYATNYLQAALIPRCSKVSVTKKSKKKMKFTLESSGAEYEYLHHKKAAPEGFEANLKKYFGTECSSSEVTKLSETDQDGIKKGRVALGMTKQGVILAIGYPPEHVTPSTDMDQWRYWKNKFATRLFYFENGKVSEITG